MRRLKTQPLRHHSVAKHVAIRRELSPRVPLDSLHQNVLASLAHVDRPIELNDREQLGLGVAKQERQERPKTTDDKQTRREE